MRGVAYLSLKRQAGKGALPWDHPFNAGSIGVTGSSAANALATEADLVLAIGTRLQDFTTASRSLFKGKVIQLNVSAFDAGKHGATALVGDAQLTLQALDKMLSSWTSSADWVKKTKQVLPHGITPSMPRSLRQTPNILRMLK